nr:MAG TPA: hypothetical protein [Caudoviricetes sp.]
MARTRGLYVIIYLIGCIERDMRILITNLNYEGNLVDEATGIERFIVDIGVFMIPLVSSHAWKLRIIDDYQMWCEVFYTMGKLVDQIDIQMKKHKKEVLEVYPQLKDSFRRCKELKDVLLEYNLFLEEVYETR